MKTFICLALSLVSVVYGSSVAAAQALPDAPVKKFHLTKTQWALYSEWTAEGLVRTLDAQSTRANLENPCRCYIEVNTPNQSATTKGQYLYSLETAAMYDGLSFLAHKLHHDKIAMAIPMFDITIDSRAVAHNYQIAGKK